MRRPPPSPINLYDWRIRRLRHNPLLFDSDEDHKIHRILGKALARRRKLREKYEPPAAKGQYSGMTKRELAATGTCETDWF